MPPVLAIIPLIASIALAAFSVSAVISAIVMAVVTIAVMVATKLLTKKPKGNRINQGADLQTKINPSLPRTVLVGNTAIGPSVHFVYTYTDDSTKPNRYLLRVMQISDQPISSLLAVLEGKNTLTFAGDVTTGWYACNQHLKKDGTPAMWMRVYTGVFSGAIADSTLISVTGGLWTSAHKGTGLSYAIVKYDYDSDAFPDGEPELVFAVQGAPVYDDRADSTVSGGSGSQRLASPSTWAYNDNTALIIAQYLRGFFINGVRIIGVGAEQKDLLPAMLFSAYNTCDQSVSYSGGTEKRYVCGMTLSSDSTAEDDLTDLALAMDGKVFDRGGSITIWPGAVRTPVLNVQMQDIDWTAEKSWQPKASLAQIVNCVQGNFVDKDNFYQERDLPVRVNHTWETDDGGQRFAQFISMKAVNRWSQAQRVTHRIHQASRFNGIMAVVGGLWLMEMECGDWFTATIPRWNFTSKYFEVEELTLTSDIRIALIGTEVSTTLDDWAHAVDEFDRSDTYWNSPPYNLVVPTFSLSPYSFYDSLSGVQDFGFNFTLLSPLGRSGTYGEDVEIQYALTANLAVTWSGGVMSLDQVQRVHAGLQPGTSYSVRARTTDGKRTSAWSSWAVVNTAAANTAFASALGGIASDDNLTVIEKKTLQAVYNDLENRYVAALARGTAVGLSTTGLTTAHTNWLNYLASLNPAWNDTTQSTSLYTGLFADKLFPAGWTLNTATTSAAGIYTTVIDSSTSVLSDASRSAACAALTQYSTGIVVKKDTQGQAIRCPMFRMVSSGGTGKTGTLVLDTLTGASAVQNLDAYSVTDTGDSWTITLTMTTATGDNLLAFKVVPSASQNLSLTANVVFAGSVTARAPRMALGTRFALGLDAIVSIETDLVNQIELLWETISQTDGLTSVVIDAKTPTIIYADSTGAVKTGELPRTVQMSASAGFADVTTLGVWSITSPQGITATIGSATGLINITAMAGSSVTIPVTFVYAGLTRTYQHPVSKVVDGTAGGGTSSGGVTSTITTLGNTTGTSYDLTNAVSAVLSVAAGASGQVACSAPITFKRLVTGSGDLLEDAYGKWQWRVVGGTFADIATEVISDYPAESNNVGFDPHGNFDGGMTVNQTKTGLTNGTTYEFRFAWREATAGSQQRLYRTSGNLSVTGS